jgi:2-haloacid dehalogenase
MQAKRTGAVFDLGGVLIDWNPRHLYRKLFPGDEAGMERFLSEVCSPSWNLEQDRGRSWAEATALLVAQYPDHSTMIRAYHARWREMLAGPIEGSVEILRELKQAGVPLYALTNWSRETFPHALALYDFLGWFEAIIVSGQEGLVKPDPRIFQLLADRHGLDFTNLAYIDDSPRNAAAATELGMHGIHFTAPAQLRDELNALGLLRS